MIKLPALIAAAALLAATSCGIASSQVPPSAPAATYNQLTNAQLDQTRVSLASMPEGWSESGRKTPPNRTYCEKTPPVTPNGGALTSYIQGTLSGQPMVIAIRQYSSTADATAAFGFAKANESTCSRNVGSSGTMTQNLYTPQPSAGSAAFGTQATFSASPGGGNFYEAYATVGPVLIDVSYSATRSGPALVN